MYFQSFDQLGQHDVQNVKILIHNGTQYDATLFVEKSEFAKQIFQDRDTYSFQDNVLEPVFETFFWLTVGQVTKYHIDFLPDILELARTWKCNGVENTIEMQLLDYPNPDLILHVLLICPNTSFHLLYQYVSKNLVDFINHPALFELPVISLGRIFYTDSPEYSPHPEYHNHLIYHKNNQNRLSPEGPTLQGYKYKDHILQLIQNKRENDQKIEIAKQNETLKLEKLRKRNDELISEKKSLLSQRIRINQECESILEKIEVKKKQIAEIEFKYQNSSKNADELRNDIQQLKREISQREQQSKQKDTRKRNRQGKK